MNHYYIKVILKVVVKELVIIMKKFSPQNTSKVRYLALGILIGSMMFPVVSFADTILEDISVSSNSVSVVANGAEVDADNFVYNGTTYVPLRACAEALNEEVTYEESTKTVIIGEDTRAEQASIQENIDNNVYPVTDNVTYYDWEYADVPDLGSFFGIEEESFAITYSGLYSYKYNFQFDKECLYLYGEHMETLGYEVIIDPNMDYYDGTTRITCRKDDIEISVGLSYYHLLIVQLEIND